MKDKKHIVLIVPRGEAVRNFLYSDTIKVLSANADVTVLSVVDDPEFLKQFREYTKEIIKLEEYKEHRFINFLRALIHDSHFFWLKSYVGLNYFERNKKKAKQTGHIVKYNIRHLLFRFCANPLLLRWLTKLENELTWMLRPNNYFVDLFKRLKPDLVFNTSHIHGIAGELPSRIAHKMGIPLAGFVFSWDNLTSRSRIMVPYDYYFVWTDEIKEEMKRIYPFVSQDRVFPCGTPQFDYHFKDEFYLTREELAKKIGIDPSRPYILYTTGIARHWPEEHLAVRKVIELMQKLDLPQKPQLVVRAYAKGTSKEMFDIRDENIPGVHFPPVEWDEVLFTPSYNDLSIYSSMLKHAALGINGASTVTLELYIFGKPVINLAYDPTGSNIDYLMRYYRNFLFDHFKKVMESNGSATAYSDEDLEKYIAEAFAEPEKRLANQKAFISKMFGSTLDGKSGQRIAEVLIDLAERKN
jgi:hypothetical protein